MSTINNSNDTNIENEDASCLNTKIYMNPQSDPQVKLLYEAYEAAFEVMFILNLQILNKYLFYYLLRIIPR